MADIHQVCDLFRGEFFCEIAVKSVQNLETILIFSKKIWPTGNWSGFNCKAKACLGETKQQTFLQMGMFGPFYSASPTQKGVPWDSKSPPKPTTLVLSGR